MIGTGPDGRHRPIGSTCGSSGPISLRRRCPASCSSIPAPETTPRRPTSSYERRGNAGSRPTSCARTRIRTSGRARRTRTPWAWRPLRRARRVSEQRVRRALRGARRRGGSRGDTPRRCVPPRLPRRGRPAHDRRPAGDGAHRRGREQRLPAPPVRARSAGSPRRRASPPTRPSTASLCACRHRSSSGSSRARYACWCRNAARTWPTVRNASSSGPGSSSRANQRSSATSSAGRASPPTTRAAQ